MSWHTCPVLTLMSPISFLGSLVIAVISLAFLMIYSACHSCSDKVVLSRYSCLGCPVTTVTSYFGIAATAVSPWLSFHKFLSRLSCRSYLITAVCPFCHGCPSHSSTPCSRVLSGRPVMLILSRLSYHSCPIIAILKWLFCGGLVLSLLCCPGWPAIAVLKLLSGST